MTDDQKPPRTQDRQQPVDDALLAATTLALSSGAEMIAAAYLGAAAAAVQVQRLGNQPVGAADIRRQIARTQSSHLAYTGGGSFIEARDGGTLLKAS